MNIDNTRISFRAEHWLAGISFIVSLAFFLLASCVHEPVCSTGPFASITPLAPPSLANSATSVIAQILTTVLAIGISLALLAVEYSSNRYSYSLVSDAISSVLPIVLLVFYLVTILLSSFLSFYPVFVNTLSQSIVVSLFFWCILNLVSYTVFIAHVLDASTLHNSAKGNIPNNYLSAHREVQKITDRTQPSANSVFLDIERVIIKSNQSENIDQFLLWLRILYDTEISYLSDIDGYQLEKEDQDKLNRVVQYFLSLRKLIFTAVVKNNNEQFSISIIQYESDVLIELVVSYFPESTRTTLAHFHTMGRVLVDNELENAIDWYTSCFREMIKQEFDSIPTSSRSEQDERAFRQRVFSSRMISEEQISYIAELSQAASDKGFNDTVNSILGTLHWLEVSVWQELEDSTTKRGMLYESQRSRNEVYENAISCGLSVSPFGDRPGLMFTLRDITDGTARRDIIDQYVSLAIQSGKEKKMTPLRHITHGIGTIEDIREVFSDIAEVLADVIDEQNLDSEIEGYLVASMLHTRDEAADRGVDISDQVNKFVSIRGYSTAKSQGLVFGPADHWQPAGPQ